MADAQGQGCLRARRLAATSQSGECFCRDWRRNGIGSDCADERRIGERDQSKDGCRPWEGRRRSPRRWSMRPSALRPRDIVGKFYEHVPPGDIVGRSPARSLRRSTFVVALCRAAAAGPGEDSRSQPRPVGRWLVIAAHDRRDRQRRHAVPRRFRQPGDQRQRPRRPPRHSPDHDGRARPARTALEVRDLEAAGRRESWMHVEITALIGSRRPRTAGADIVGSPRRRPRRGRRLAADARAPEGASRRAVAPAFAAGAARRNLAEVEDFLRWLDDDNFTFLGYREYLFDRAAEPGPRTARDPA